MNAQTRRRLSAMMFLQYMVLGSWQPVLSEYMVRLGFTSSQIGIIYSLLPMAGLITPFIGGQLSDRYVNTEKLLGVTSLLGGLLLCVMARVTSFDYFLPLMLLWSLLYAPTSALINSITFHHLPDAETKFSLVRVFGTLGWIVVGLLLTGIRHIWPEQQGLMWLGGADSLWLGGFISILLGLFYFKLPKTPPTKNSQHPWAFTSVLAMLRVPSTALFIAAFFIMATGVMFYTVLTAPFLRSTGISSENVPAVMTIAQAAEIGIMLALPWMLKYIGIHKTLLIGILAYLVRYAVFASGLPTWLILVALALHGLCFTCFNVVSYIYINSLATPDIRASAQAVIIFVSGTGRFLGSILVGRVADHYTTASLETRVIDYQKVFLVACALTTACLILFFLTFMRQRSHQSEQSQDIKKMHD